MIFIFNVVGVSVNGTFQASLTTVISYYIKIATGRVANFCSLLNFFHLFDVDISQNI